MAKIQSVVQIEASVDAVWDVLTDMSYIVKLFRDAILVRIDPPGRSFVGQRYHLTGKAGRRKVEILLEVSEMSPKARLTVVHRPGGLFESFKQRTTLAARAGGTEARTVFEYELSRGYIGKALSLALVQNLVRDNLEPYSNTLKEISELRPMPARKR